MNSSTPQISADGLRLQPLTYNQPVSEIVRQLVAQLQTGHFDPGSKLPPERKLAEALGIGRSTLREALKTLAVLGFLEIRSGDGTYLSSHPSSLLPDIIEWGLLLGNHQATALIEARARLEVTVAELAADRAGESDVAAMEAAVQRMVQAETDQEFVDADVEFHMALAEACGNPVLAGIIRNVKALLRVWVLRAIAVIDREEVVRQHQEITSALLQGDPSISRTAMESHMNSVTHSLLHSLRQKQ